MLVAMDKSHNQTPAALVKAIVKLATPLVRLLLHFQITFPVFSQMLKRIYIDIADQEFGIDNKPPTDSRISLLTGIHRKDVKRFRHDEPDQNKAPETFSVGTQLISVWLSDPAYLDSEGKPKALPKASPKNPGNAISFETLVASVTKQDIRPKVVLEEWLRLGVVHIQDNQVVLNANAFVPQQGFDEKAFFFGKNLHDHIAAGTHNLLNGQPPQFDRAVFYNRLTPDAISALESMINDRASQLLVDVNKEAKRLQIKSRGNAKAHFRFNLGAYFWVEHQAPAKFGDTNEKD